MLGYIISLAIALNCLLYKYPGPTTPPAQPRFGSPEYASKSLKTTARKIRSSDQCRIERNVVWAKTKDMEHEPPPYIHPTTSDSTVINSIADILDAPGSLWMGESCACSGEPNIVFLKNNQLMATIQLGHDGTTFKIKGYRGEYDVKGIDKLLIIIKSIESTQNQ